MMKLKTCVTPEGRFIYGLHRPHFHISNLREKESLCSLGVDETNANLMNHRNFPETSVDEPNADLIYEVPNPFPFRGTTFIASGWAAAKARNPSAISLPKPAAMSFTKSLIKGLETEADIDQILAAMPQQILLTIGTESTDPEELVRLAKLCCEFQYDDSGNPIGIRYINKSNGPRAVLPNHELFETVVNNPNLPEELREIMVLRPGVQGDSEITADYADPTGRTHIYEYLRRNSYIPWGHFAANMAEDAVRYDMGEMSETDMKGLRHLYYQRTYARIGELLGVGSLDERKQATAEELEALRVKICEKITSDSAADLFFTATLWGWNYGANYTPAGYNLHGSHQQIHQQYALIPATTEANSSFGQAMGEMETYGCGDQVFQFIRSYREAYGTHFFDDYLTSIRNNRRMDRDDEQGNSLIVYEDDNVILFVPKAQTSQWELNLMVKKSLGNILETETAVRDSLDSGMQRAMKTLTALGARMITVIEFSGRFGQNEEKQHLFYAFLPKIPYSMGAFTEAQLRYINGHFPEDFATACRAVL